MPDINKIQKIVGPIAHFYGVKRVYLFGSYVTTAGIEDDFRKEIAGTEILLYEE